MATVTPVDFEPLTVAVPLWEDPPGVFRVGNSRVLLELVLSAFKRGETPESIVRSYRTLNLADVYALSSAAIWRILFLSTNTFASARKRPIPFAARLKPHRGRGFPRMISWPADEREA